MSAILFSGSIGPVPVSVIVRESHSSSLGIAEQPIETGAKITDHSYVDPKRVSLEFGDANAAATYNALVRFQESRMPFTMVTGLYVYTNMLIKELSADRDETYSRVLKGTANLQEIIIVSTAHTASESENGVPLSSGKAGGVKSAQSARPTSERAGDPATVNRTAPTTLRGDAATRTLPDRSILDRFLQ